MSKQAARQRFAQAPPAVGDAGTKHDARSLACLALAGREAAAGGAAEIGTHHQLIALFDDPVAGPILDRLGSGPRPSGPRPVRCFLAWTRPPDLLRVLAADPGSYICAECIGLCNDILKQEAVGTR